MESNAATEYIGKDSTEANYAKEECVKKENAKPRRVGTVSVGLSMVAFGVMFLLCSVFGILSYETIFAMWPLILILFGLELLVFSFFKGKLIYDKGSVFIMILMMFLAVGMAGADICWKAVEYYMPYL